MPEETADTKTILCLANSRKMLGRCVAGKEIVGTKTGGWVRPVSAREHQEISVSDRRYEDGSLASLLDIISIPVLSAKPEGHQTENYLIADKQRWKKTATATWDQIEKAVDAVPGPLWINGYSSGSGTNDRIPEAEAGKLTTSLVLVKPEQVMIIVPPDKQSVRVRFTLNNVSYNLGLTDAAMEQKYRNGKSGTFPVEGALLCISLGEPFKGYVYKLAAALITPDRVGKSDG